MSLLVSCSVRQVARMDIAKRKSFTYILSNRHRNVLFGGATNDLRKQVDFHKRHLIPGFTKKYNVDQLIYFEAHDDIDTALVRERQIKGCRREKKIQLIQQVNPESPDLYETLGW